MIFLIHFSRANRRMVQFTVFGDEHREQAFHERAELERQARLTETDDEIVLLEAHSLDDLRRTHSRYFAYLDAGHTTITRYGDVSTPPLAVRERPPTDAD